MGRKEGRLFLFYTFLYLNIYIFLKEFYFCYFIIKFLYLKILVGGRERGDFYLIKPVADVSLSGGPVWAHALPLPLRAGPLSLSIFL